MTMIQPIRPAPSGPHASAALHALEHALDWADPSPEQVSLRQLRHHTKNALQRLLCQVSACAGLQQDAAGRALAKDLERRIHLSATVSDALFGLTATPPGLDSRLDHLARGVVGLLSDGDQEIGVEVTVRGRVPARLDDVLVRIAHELVGNAVKHGMTLRMVGRIELLVDAGPEAVVLIVSDDGWGLCPEAPVAQRRGEGLRIAMVLAGQCGGELVLRRDGFRTQAVVTLPVAA